MTAPPTYKKRNRGNRPPPGPRVQPNEFLDKQATVTRPSTHQYDGPDLGAVRGGVRRGRLMD